MMELLKMDSVKITPDLVIQPDYLILPVDFSKDFTLKDLFLAIGNSTIPIDLMCIILRCRHIPEFLEEIKGKDFDGDSEIEYLEIYWHGANHNGDCYTLFGFHGVGRKGVVPEDLLDAGVQIDNPEGYREQYAIEYSPLYKLSGYNIRIKPVIQIGIWEKGKYRSEEIPVTPTITLIELLDTVMREVAFFGGPKDRDDVTEKLKNRLDEFERVKAEGTLKTKPHVELDKYLGKFEED